MQCLYLSINEGTRSCQRMLDLGMAAEVTDFDIEHFCEGNPVCCYFFRVSLDLGESRERSTPRAKVGRLFKNISHNVEVELRR
jgi:hypothetical protein